MRCTGKIKINQIPLGIWFIFNNHKLDSAGNFTGTQATSANVDRARRTIDHNTRALEVGRPGTAGLTMRVADLIAGMAALITDSTNPRHGLTPPFTLNNMNNIIILPQNLQAKSLFIGKVCLPLDGKRGNRRWFTSF